jgi:hypothetical protein
MLQAPLKECAHTGKGPILNKAFDLTQKCLPDPDDTGG